MPDAMIDKQMLQQTMTKTEHDANGTAHPTPLNAAYYSSSSLVLEE